MDRDERVHSPQIGICENVMLSLPSLGHYPRSHRDRQEHALSCRSFGTNWLQTFLPNPTLNHFENKATLYYRGQIRKPQTTNLCLHIYVCMQMHMRCSFVSAKDDPRSGLTPGILHTEQAPTSAACSNQPGTSAGKNRQPHGWLAAWEPTHLLVSLACCVLGSAHCGGMALAQMAHAANLPPENYAIRKLAASTHGSPGSTSKWHVSLSWYKIHRR